MKRHVSWVGNASTQTLSTKCVLVTKPIVLSALLLFPFEWKIPLFQWYENKLQLDWVLNSRMEESPVSIFPMMIPSPTLTEHWKRFAMKNISWLVLSSFGYYYAIKHPKPRYPQEYRICWSIGVSLNLALGWSCGTFTKLIREYEAIVQRIVLDAHSPSPTIHAPKNSPISLKYLKIKIWIKMSKRKIKDFQILTERNLKVSLYKT